MPETPTSVRWVEGTSSRQRPTERARGAHAVDPDGFEDERVCETLCGLILLRPDAVTGDARGKVRCPACQRRAKSVGQAR